MAPVLTSVVLLAAGKTPSHVLTSVEFCMGGLPTGNAEGADKGQSHCSTQYAGDTLQLGALLAWAAKR